MTILKHKSLFDNNRRYSTTTLKITDLRSERILEFSYHNNRPKSQNLTKIISYAGFFTFGRLKWFLRLLPLLKRR